jgi:peptidoglycan/xylan/chitin deacetylase (PgdA/CDA1 family)
MFHHFHDQKHLPAQGSLGSKDFSDMLDWLSERYNLIGAKEYLEKFEGSSLQANDICLSFDDALLSQYDVAIPILNERKIDAFFFVYSSVFSGNPDNLEVFRYFRTNNFESIDGFYQYFFAATEEELGDNLNSYFNEYQNLNYLSAFPFYTENDKWFRYLRDVVLGPVRYEHTMLKIMEKREFYSQDIVRNLWMSESNLQEIAMQGHLVGLHSFSHPTEISKLSFDEQYEQYDKNYKHLKSLVGDVVSVGHPCGDYNNDTLKILDDLGIRIGFRSSLSVTAIKGKFEIPRNDHANIFKAMK